MGLGFLIPRLNISKPAPVFETATQNQSQKSLKIKVDVEGAVKKPKVYDLYDGARIEDAIKAAGGLTQWANKDWIAKNLNLAQVITDGAKLYIPSSGDTGISSNDVGSALGVTTVGSQSVSGQVNINTASAEQLDTLPRIGPVTAQKIIAGRPYSSVQDLLNKKVVGPKTFDGLKDLVSVQ